MVGRQRRIVMTVNQFFTAGRVVVASDVLTVLPAHFVETTGMAHGVVRELPLKVPDVHVDALCTVTPTTASTPVVVATIKPASNETVN